MINSFLNKGNNKKYYVLRNNHSKKVVNIVINSKKYSFIVDNKYFEEPYRDFFNIKEKLYVLGHPSNVTWYPVSRIYKTILSVFFICITPYNLGLDVTDGSVQFKILANEHGGTINEQIY